MDRCVIAIAHFYVGIIRCYFVRMTRLTEICNRASPAIACRIQHKSIEFDEVTEAYLQLKGKLNRRMEVIIIIIIFHCSYLYIFPI